MNATVLYPTAVMVAIAVIAMVVLSDMTATTVIEIAQMPATTLAISVSVAISKTNFIVVIILFCICYFHPM
jgi:hypothetical protein